MASTKAKHFVCLSVCLVGRLVDRLFISFIAVHWQNGMCHEMYLIVYKSEDRLMKWRSATDPDLDAALKFNCGGLAHKLLMNLNFFFTLNN